MKYTKPQVGQIMKVYGQDCRIIKVWPFGIVDVVSVNSNKSFRVTGLAFL